MQGIDVGMLGICVRMWGMWGIGVRIPGIKVVMRGIKMGMWGI